jgi:hypothetical protein
MRINEIILEDFDGADEQPDLSDPKYSQSKSIDPNGILLSILTNKREELLFHHSDPQMSVTELIQVVNNPGINPGGSFDYQKIKAAVDSGALDSVVEKLSTDTTTGENYIIFKGNEAELPDGTGGGTGAGMSGKDPSKIVSGMAKRAAGA